ncbi:hypothetical protein ECH_0215 [Ehrlichia chaffeensis str. Arkansas]|uniref:Uncharacterized protein n=1 Tax=Ehrlichia chaffeensis (strain ATCC CRL-10679 / Arkansas) TaxID=205920 RepID=Q2GHP5_EHRCR|nr:hypothetical protein ECH_0215 [Ehrlichia chaffeensis str. Arkansas]
MYKKKFLVVLNYKKICVLKILEHWMLYWFYLEYVSSMIVYRFFRIDFTLIGLPVIINDEICRKATHLLHC